MENYKFRTLNEIQTFVNDYKNQINNISFHIHSKRSEKSLDDFIQSASDAEKSFNGIKPTDNVGEFVTSVGQFKQSVNDIKPIDNITEYITLASNAEQAFSGINVTDNVTEYTTLTSNAEQAFSGINAISLQSSRHAGEDNRNDEDFIAALLSLIILSSD